MNIIPSLPQPHSCTAFCLTLTLVNNHQTIHTKTVQHCFASHKQLATVQHPLRYDKHTHYPALTAPQVSGLLQKNVNSTAPIKLTHTQKDEALTRAPRRARFGLRNCRYPAPHPPGFQGHPARLCHRRRARLIRHEMQLAAAQRASGFQDLRRVRGSLQQDSHKSMPRVPQELS